MYYTKYRPQKFSEISKPNETAEALMNQVKTGKTVHAYLFVGSRGTGKTTAARILAKALNCQKISKNGDPCDKCDSCKAIKNGSYIDLIEIDAASNRGIDDVRDLREKIKLSPSVGDKKVYIVDEVHMLTTEAFNALLKTLEEPPKHAVFILCTTEFHKVPETIRSRCQVFKFKKPSITQLVVKLGAIVKSEKADVSKEDLKKIAAASLGGFRDAETLLQQVIEGGVEIDSIAYSAGTHSYIELVDLLLSQNCENALRVITKVYEDGVDLSVWTGDLLLYLRDVLFVASGVSDYVADASDEILASVTKHAKNFEISTLTKFIDRFLKAQLDIKDSCMPQLPLELAVVELCGNVKVVDTVAVEEQVSVEVEEPEVEEEEVVDEEKEKAPVPKSVEVKNTFRLEDISDSWPQFLNKLFDQNKSIHALINGGSPVKIENNFVIVEVAYAFHKERLEDIKNRKVVEDILCEINPEVGGIKCVLSKDKPKQLSEKETGELTDRNVVAPRKAALPTSISKVFDGGLPF